jgi:hypothetical protein
MERLGRGKHVQNATFVYKDVANSFSRDNMLATTSEKCRYERSYDPFVRHQTTLRELSQNPVAATRKAALTSSISNLQRSECNRSYILTVISKSVCNHGYI